MPLYKYKARDKNGNLVVQTIDMDTLQNVESFTKEQQYTVIQIREVPNLVAHYDKMSIIQKNSIAVYCRQFSYVYGSGVPIISVLQILESQSQNKVLKKQILFITREVMKGNTLSDSMRASGKFPEFLCSMTEVGELGGNLALIYEKMSDYYEREIEIEGNVKGAMTYPTVVASLLFVVVIASVIYLIPSYADIYRSQGADLPIITEFLIQIGEFVINHILHISFSIFGFIMLFCAFLRTDKGVYYKDKFIVRAPIIKVIYTKTIQARFANILSLLLESGVPIMRAIFIAKKVVNNRFLDATFDNMIKEMERGTSIGVVAERSALFEPIFYSMLKVGEEAGKMEEVLKKCVEYFDREVAITIKTFSKLIEPTLLLVVGLVLGFVMLTIMLPAFNIGNILV